MTQTGSSATGGNRNQSANPDAPMTLAERDDLISKINILTPQQSEGIIKIVAEHAQKDG